VDSSNALLRIVPMLQSNYLTEAECKRVGEALWNTSENYTILPYTGLFVYALLLLPTPNKRLTTDLVRQKLFPMDEDAIIETSTLREIVAAATNTSFSMIPSPEVAKKYLTKLANWRPKEENSDQIDFSFSRSDKASLPSLIGDVISQSVVPALIKEDFDESNFENIFAFYRATKSSEVLVAFIHFAVANESFVERVEKLISHALHVRDPRGISHASLAVLKWRTLGNNLATERLIHRLIYMTGSSQVAGTGSLLWCINEMLKNGFLSDSDANSLTEILPIIFDSANYQMIYQVNKDAINFSLLRARCVEVSKSLMLRYFPDSTDLIRILHEARSDPLPEVRFAGEP
jgi:hypothetical protein